MWPAEITDQGYPSYAALGGELLATLATARGENGAAGPGAHPLAEAVDLSPPTVVRLERTLAHWNSRSFGEDALCQKRTCHAPRGQPLA